MAKIATSNFPNVSNKKAFTLFELMIVVIIIGIVYSLLIAKVSLNNSTKDELNLDNLPQFLINNYHLKDEKTKLLCYDDCGTCAIFHDKINNFSSKEITKINKQIFKENSHPRAYFFYDNELNELDFGEFKLDDKLEQICFSYMIYPNKTAQKIVLEYDEKFYLYSNDKTQIFSTSDSVLEFLQNQNQEAKKDDL